VSLLLGFPLAWLLVILPRGWSALVFGIVLLSMWTNLLARTYAWMVLLQSSGLINRVLIGLGVISSPLPLVNNLTGVTIGMTYIMLPFIVLPLHATISAIDPAILRAATLCGANRWQVFRDVFLPSCLPGIAAGCLMVFVMSLGYFVTPSLLGGSANVMLAEYIAQLVQSMLDWGTGSAAAFLLLAITLVLYWLQLRLVDPLATRRLD
jgi:putative spermidine/putrescine transport system permease protein